MSVLTTFLHPIHWQTACISMEMLQNKSDFSSEIWSSFQSAVMATSSFSLGSIKKNLCYSKLAFFSYFINSQITFVTRKLGIYQNLTSFPHFYFYLSVPSSLVGIIELVCLLVLLFLLLKYIFTIVGGVILQKDKIRSFLYPELFPVHSHSLFLGTFDYY